jgi:hypothetical protein
VPVALVALRSLPSWLERWGVVVLFGVVVLRWIEESLDA